MAEDGASTRRSALRGLAGIGAGIGAAAAGAGGALAAEYGPLQRLTIGAAGFRPDSGASHYSTVDFGGIFLPSGNAADTFHADLRLPAGYLVTKVSFVIRPNGISVPVSLSRNRLTPSAQEPLILLMTGGGFANEVVEMGGNTPVKAGWSYLIGAHLLPQTTFFFGATVDYRGPI
jgi:hypothetical protein